MATLHCVISFVPAAPNRFLTSRNILVGYSSGSRPIAGY